jgi:hypothetical protein
LIPFSASEVICPRQFKDGHFIRLFALAHVDGGFRIALLPDPEKVSPHRDRVPSRDKAETENNTQVAEGLVQLIRQKIRQLGTRLVMVLFVRNTEEEVPGVKPELFRRSYFAANKRQRYQS